jgi:hypothetical protein
VNKEKIDYTVCPPLSEESIDAAIDEIRRIKNKLKLDLGDNVTEDEAYYYPHDDTWRLKGHYK